MLELTGRTSEGVEEDAVWDIYRYFYFSENLSSGDTNSKWYHTGLYHFQSLGNLPSAAGAARVERRRRSPRGEAEPWSEKILSFKKGIKRVVFTFYIKK